MIRTPESNRKLATRSLVEAICELDEDILKESFRLWVGGTIVCHLALCPCAQNEP